MLFYTPMAEYIRARSDEHKEERMTQIKDATATLFESAPYAEITLTTIAEKLGWSRANLYKYVTTKEEIILEIAADKMEAYYGSLISAMPEGTNFSTEVIGSLRHCRNQRAVGNQLLLLNCGLESSMQIRIICAMCLI